MPAPASATRQGDISPILPKLFHIPYQSKRWNQQDIHAEVSRQSLIIPFSVKNPTRCSAALDLCGVINNHAPRRLSIVDKDQSAPIWLIKHSKLARSSRELNETTYFPMRKSTSIEFFIMGSGSHRPPLPQVSYALMQILTPPSSLISISVTCFLNRALRSSP